MEQLDNDQIDELVFFREKSLELAIKAFPNKISPEIFIEADAILDYLLNGSKKPENNLDS